MLHLPRDPAKVRGRAGQAAWPFALLGSQSRAIMFGDGVGCRVCVWGPPHPGVSWPNVPSLPMHMSSFLPASSVTTFTGEPNMCPRCGKRVYFGKGVSGQWVLASGWHGPMGQQPWGMHEAGSGVWIRERVVGTEGCA